MNTKEMVRIVNKDEKRIMASKVELGHKKKMVRKIDLLNESNNRDQDLRNIGDNLRADDIKNLQEPMQVQMCKRVHKDEESNKEEEKSHKVKIGFIETYKGVFWDDVYIMNATVEILDILSEDEVNGEGEKIHCRVHVFNRPSFEKVIGVREFREGRWLWNHASIIFKCDKKQVLDKIYLYMNFLLEKANVKRCSFRERQGWTIVDGKHCYATKDGIIGGDISVRSRRGIKWLCAKPMSYQKTCFDFFLEMQYVTGSNPTATVMMLYLVQSILYSLYKDANVVPKFCIFVEGTKGSHKTSMAMALMKPNNDTVPKFTFKDTTAGLETGFAENADGVMIIDDLMPVEDNVTKRKLEYNLEFLTRCFGDANGKNRNLDFCDGKGPKKQYSTHGGAIFTGEYVNFMCASSLARILVLHLDGDTVDINRLTYYQENATMLSTFLQYFILYVGKNYETVVELIGKVVKRERSVWNRKFSNARYAEYLAQLKAAANVLGWYGVSIGCLQKERLDGFVDNMIKLVQSVIISNDNGLKEEDPVKKLYLQYLKGLAMGT